MAEIICTVDIVLLTLKGSILHVALLKRDREPFKGLMALPGGYVHADKDADAQDAAIRTLHDKTGIASPYLEQLEVFSGPARDPRGWSISISYYALVPLSLIEATGHATVELVATERVKGLPFDHKQIIEAAVSRVRNKSSYSSLPVYLCGEQFTLPQLQSVYEALLGESINKVSFRRKMDELAVLEPIEGAMETGKANRPAQLYRLKRRYKQKLSMTDRGLNPGSQGSNDANS